MILCATKDSSPTCISHHDYLPEKVSWHARRLLKRREITDLMEINPRWGVQIVQAANTHTFAPPERCNIIEEKSREKDLSPHRTVNGSGIFASRCLG